MFSVSISKNVGAVNISIVNIWGEKVFEIQSSKIKTDIDLSNNSNGIYFMRINAEKSFVTKKIIINK